MSGHDDDLPSGDAVVAMASDVVRGTAAHVTDDWEAFAARRPRAEGIVGGIRHLTLINCHQWHLEDECRRDCETPLRLAEIKHAIDASNHRRVNEIDHLDDAFVDVFRRRRGGSLVGRHVLSSPGEVIDRLSILVLRLHHLEHSDAPGLGDESAALITQRRADDLAGAFDGLVDDVLAGRRRLERYRTVKLYG